jgi:hypothetical protein
MEYGDIEVSLVDSMDSRSYAWELSRGVSAPLESIEMLDLTANSLKVVSLKMTTSVAFRELLTTIRPHFMWSQTSRVLDLHELKIPRYYEEYKHVFESSLEFINSQFNHVYDLLSKGAHQDEARMYLPIAYLSSYVMAMDFRTWVSMLKSLKVLSPFYYERYGTRIEEQLGLLKPLDEYPYGYAIPIQQDTSNSEVESFFKEIAGNVVAKVKLSIGLRAQLARHIRISLQDPLWYMAYHVDYLESLSTNDELDAIIACPSDTWTHLVSHRACWIAHTEIWSGLIRPYIDAVGLRAAIPCHGVKEDCPFKLDNISRVELKDPGIPCPVFTKDIYDTDARVALIKKRRLYVDEWLGLLDD